MCVLHSKITIFSNELFRSDASYEEEQNLDPAFMENNMQLDESADQQSVPTDVNIEDLSGKSG